MVWKCWMIFCWKLKIKGACERLIWKTFICSTYVFFERHNLGYQKLMTKISIDIGDIILRKMSWFLLNYSVFLKRLIWNRYWRKQTLISGMSFKNRYVDCCESLISSKRTFSSSCQDRFDLNIWCWCCYFTHLTGFMYVKIVFI